MSSAREITRRTTAAVAGLLPASSLPAAVWTQRHRSIQWILWAHVPGLFILALFAGQDPRHVVGEVALVGVFGGAASIPWLSKVTRSCIATLGLITASAILVHVTAGTIEAHFHYFVAVALIALYQHRYPFLLAMAFVFVQHGVLGTIDPAAVYNHPEGVASPWLWATIHAGFILAMSTASTAAWRLNVETARQATRAELHDTLTGLPNRLWLDRLAEEHMPPLDDADALVIIDIHRFADLNDRLGHAAGDAILVEVARRMRAALRARDLLARGDGDQFVAVMRHATGRDDAVRLADSLMARVTAAAIPIGGRPVALELCAGVALWAAGEGGREALRQAGAALSQAQRSGGPQLVYYDPGVGSRTEDRLRLGEELREGLDRDEIVVHYQPLVALRDNRIVGAEALVRWQHPTRGLLPPGAFLDVAEGSGLLRRLEERVLGIALARLGRWQADGLGHLRLSVNVSTALFSDPDLVEIIETQLRSTGASADRLELEIPESVSGRPSASVVRRLVALSELGIQLAVDDFGAGYSFLPYLGRLPLGTIKLDRTLVGRATTNSEDAVVAHAVIAMAHRLRLSVVAEGIETQEQLAHFRSRGCDIGQGYLLARPMPVEQLEPLLHLGRIDSVLEPTPPIAAADLVTRGRSRPRVLVIDDDPANRRLIGRYLDRADCAVVEAADGQAARAVVSGSAPDVIIADAGIDTAALVDWLRADPNTAATPVIVIARDSVHVPAGIDGLLSKPLDAAAFRSVVVDTLRAIGRAA